MLRRWRGAMALGCLHGCNDFVFFSVTTLDTLAWHMHVYSGDNVRPWEGNREMGRMDSAGHFAMIPHLRTLYGFLRAISVFL